jgi:hypothetical protein
MTRKVVIPASLIAGLLLGGGTVEYWHRQFDQRSKQTFEQKLRCKSLADQFIRDHSGDDSHGIALGQVDYSSSSNSCFAAVTTFTRYGNALWKGWGVVDLVSGKAESMGTCSPAYDCADGRDLRYSQNMDIAFKNAIDGTSLPRIKSPRTTGK